MSKSEDFPASETSLAVTYFLAERHPVLRRRDHASGSCAERENLSP
jgi:hypothetical protein